MEVSLVVLFLSRNKTFHVNCLLSINDIYNIYPNFLENNNKIKYFKMITADIFT